MRAVATASGARWDATHNVFLHRAERLPAALAPFRPAAFSWELGVERELNDDPLITETPSGRITLRAHQDAGVAAILAAAQAKRAGFLLADDVGLGKTITAWEIGRAHV